MKYLLIICLGFCSFWVKGQVSNDECSAAIILDDVNNYCSGVGQFNKLVEEYFVGLMRTMMSGFNLWPLLPISMLGSLAI